MNQDLIALIPTLPQIKNKGDINESTRLEDDLRLKGHHVRQFIFKYADVFNVDISGFKFEKYFSKDTNVVPSFLKRKKYSITLGDLEGAIRYGRLNDMTLKEIVINKKSTPPRNRLIFGNSIRYRPEEVIVFILLGAAITVLLGWMTLMWV